MPKAILATIGNDIQEVAGALQLCAGQQAGGESAVHAMRKISDDPDTEAVLLVNVSNAFNTLNRNVQGYDVPLPQPQLV